MSKILNKVRTYLLPENESYRHSWIRNILSALPPNSRLLDAGAGTQPYRENCKHLDYRAQDFGEYQVNRDPSGLQYSDFQYGKLDYVGNVWEVEESDAVFDAILCSEVFEQIPYPHETLKEFSRLLKTGGKLILTAPFCSIPHMTPFYFYNGFSIEWYKYFLGKYGFDIDVIDANGSPPAYLAQETFRWFRASERFYVKILSAPIVIILLLILRTSHAFAKNNKINYLHFGYLITARKK